VNNKIRIGGIMNYNKIKPYGATLRPDPVDERDYNFSKVPDTNRIIKTSETIPRSWNWASSLSPVKDQGYLGSCVAFSVCALKEWQEKQEHEQEVEAGKEDHRKGKEYDLSESWVYWNAKKIDPWPNEEGTNFRSALKVIE
jgi:hypothetical protein